ncbi:M15 family metallopeptidase [Roseobacter sp. MH60115]|uniref:M15 family metallopeptidase n=1 Tax=Roseobacter sp. MH60115 TaxID=2785324 RepID=UPI0018A28E47|nr:M15 family metallopeptidase [Roseobacter sp. MH60115]
MIKMLRSSLMAFLRQFKGGAVQRSPVAQQSQSPVQRKPQKYQAAALSLRDMALVKSKLHQQQALKVSTEGAHPLIVEFYRKFHKELEARGFSFYAHCFVRDAATQRAIYRRGNSKAPPGSSPHNYGLAVDIVHSLYHWELDDDPQMAERKWRLIGVIGKEVARKANIPIEWGGDWSFWDPAHWQLKDWRKIRDGEKVFNANAYSRPLAAKLRAHKQSRTPL